MGRTERLFRITSLLRDTKSLRFEDILQRLGISPATLKRDLKYLREQLGTPIEYDAFERSYKIAANGPHGRKELPGLWFSEAELHALALAHRLLEQLDPQQKLVPRLTSVIQRAERLLSQQAGRIQLLDRVRLVIPGKRDVNAEAFDVITTALAQRRQVQMRYFTRSRGASSQRCVSPQRIVFYRTWYLDAWCHRANELRRFALDAVESVTATQALALEIPLHLVERLFDGAYGAFPGEPNRWATLVFSPTAAQWVERETWHPMQRMRRLEDGHLELVLPYREPTELAMDILRHGEHVEVQGDELLAAALQRHVVALARKYKT